MLRQPGVGDEIFLDDRGDHAGEEPGVAPGTHREVYVCLVGALGALWIDDDQGPVRVLADLADQFAGAMDAVRLPGILAEKDRDLCVFEVAVGPAAEHSIGDPELAGFLLSEGVRPMANAQAGCRDTRIGARQMIALAAAAVIEDRLAAVGVAHRTQLRSDLPDRCIPVDRLVAAVVATAHGRGQPVGPILVVIQPRGLVAQVAARGGVILVATGPCDLLAVFGQLNLHATVQRAEDACR